MTLDRVTSSLTVRYSGLLVYAGLVQFLYEDFFSEQGQRAMTRRRRWYAGGVVLLGAVCMILVGLFA